mmetsp:Transcript_9204/g.21389  ORF Transcript_9204/g.21389 Transcript_9204/m.21389 type:complete len:259 (+) Transcript_9204:1109-1885(+)
MAQHELRRGDALALPHGALRGRRAGQAVEGGVASASNFPRAIQQAELAPLLGPHPEGHGAVLPHLLLRGLLAVPLAHPERRRDPPGESVGPRGRLPRAAPPAGPLELEEVRPRVGAPAPAPAAPAPQAAGVAALALARRGTAQHQDQVVALVGAARHGAYVARPLHGRLLARGGEGRRRRLAGRRGAGPGRAGGRSAAGDGRAAVDGVRPVLDRGEGGVCPRAGAGVGLHFYCSSRATLRALATGPESRVLLCYSFVV